MGLRWEYEGTEFVNLDSFWSNLLKITSQDPGFMRSIFMSEFVTARTTAPSASSAMVYIIQTKQEIKSLRIKLESIGTMKIA